MTEGRDEEREEGQVDKEDDELESRVREMRDALEHREERIEELEERLKRARADLRNYRRRAEERIEEAEERGREALVGKFLRVRDDLARALESGGDAEAVREGVRLTLERLDSVLEGEGVEETPTSEFDPEKHEAVASIEAPDLEDGEIVEVHQAGFERDGRVLRPARVTVAEAPGEGKEE